MYGTGKMRVYRHAVYRASLEGAFFGRQGGWICGGGVLGLASAGSGGNARMAERERITLHLEALNITTDHVGNFLTTT